MVGAVEAPKTPPPPPPHPSLLPFPPAFSWLFWNSSRQGPRPCLAASEFEREKKPQPTLSSAFAAGEEKGLYALRLEWKKEVEMHLNPAGNRGAAFMLP